MHLITFKYMYIFNILNIYTLKVIVIVYICKCVFIVLNIDIFNIFYRKGA